MDSQIERTEANTIKRSKIARRNQLQWSDLPYDLVSQIADGLGLIDLVSFRGVCKEWRSGSSKASAQIEYLHEEPWFLMYGEEGSQCSLLSNLDKSYTLNLPELNGATCLASNGGWLLFYAEQYGSMFFFCPFSRAKIELPKCPFSELSGHIAAFSSAPTCQDCVVAVIRRSSDEELHVHLLFRGDNLWHEHKYHCPVAHLKTITGACFTEGAFEFSDNFTGLVSFNAKLKQWTTYIIVKTRDKGVQTKTYSNKLQCLLEKSVMGKLGLEAYASVSTCGTLIPRSNAIDILIMNENIGDAQGSENRHLKGVWFQPRYFQTSPDQSW